MTDTARRSTSTETSVTQPQVELSVGQQDRGIAPGARNYKFGGMALGLILAAVVTLIMPDSVAPEARMTAAVAILMGTWWITEAVPLAATAMIPLVAFPALDVAQLSEVAISYSSSTILLFLGGFLLAMALQRWNLHKRIAIHIVLRIGVAPARLIAGFMIATAFLSMWVSNTATAMMMIPMGMSVVKMLENEGLLPKKSKFGTGLMVGIAYGATIGGMGTLIGSPVNVIVAGYIRDTLDYPLTFVQWMSVGVPAVVIFTALGWFLIAKIIWRPEIDHLPGGRKIFEQQLSGLGKLRGGELIVTVVFVCTASAWVLVPMLTSSDFWLNDTAIALIAGLAVMVLPAKPRSGVMVMTWKDAKDTPWDVLLLIGGGLALSAQITASGLSAWLGDLLTGLRGAPEWLILLVVVILLLCITELTSSTATVAAFVPVVGGLAIALGQDPVLMVVAAGMACTCSFMLPVGTPPNAIAFSTGAISMNQMMRTGVWMNLIAVIGVFSLALTLVPVVFG